MKAFFVICLASATLYAQSAAVEAGRKATGAFNLEPGNGILVDCRDDPAQNRVTCTPSYNPAIIATHDSVHDNENFCLSTNGTTQYACKLPNKALAGYRVGMTLVLDADATCTASCALNVDGIGSVAITKSDGASPPRGALIARQPQWVFYDGRVFRLMGGGGTGGTVEDGDRQHDVTARRFIASMETIPYAKLVTLETTAGDVHKTTTSNAIGNAEMRAATPGLAGQHMWIIIVNDQLSPKTITFGENLRSAGPLRGAAGKTATLQFISDGTAWYEVARSVNL
jgi:hypothetical protein